MAILGLLLRFLIASPEFGQRQMKNFRIVRCPPYPWIHMPSFRATGKKNNCLRRAQYLSLLYLRGKTVHPFLPCALLFAHLCHLFSLPWDWYLTKTLKNSLQFMKDMFGWQNIAFWGFFVLYFIGFFGRGFHVYRKPLTQWQFGENFKS